MTNVLFNGSKAKLVAAVGHRRRLSEAIEAYAQANAAVIRSEKQDDMHVVFCDLPLPDASVSVIAGEVVYQLRSSLDLLVCDLARLSGATDTSDCYFPMAKDQAFFESAKTMRKIRKLSEDRQDRIKALRPYADVDLIALNALANTDRHNDLIYAQPLVKHMTFGVIHKSHELPSIAKLQIRKPEPLETGRIELARIPPDSGIAHMEVETTFQFVFSVAEVLGRPALPTLDAIIRRVAAIGDLIEAAEKP